MERIPKKNQIKTNFQSPKWCLIIVQKNLYSTKALKSQKSQKPYYKRKIKNMKILKGWQETREKTCLKQNIISMK